ncbi:hypothetical protein EMIT0158MI4_100066 [Burkholderia ambifaria]
MADAGEAAAHRSAGRTCQLPTAGPGSADGPLAALRQRHRHPAAGPPPLDGRHRSSATGRPLPALRYRPSAAGRPHPLELRARATLSPPIHHPHRRGPRDRRCGPRPNRASAAPRCRARRARHQPNSAGE